MRYEALDHFDDFLLFIGVNRFEVVVELEAISLDGKIITLQAQFGEFCCGQAQPVRPPVGQLSVGGKVLCRSPIRTSVHKRGGCAGGFAQMLLLVGFDVFKAVNDPAAHF